MLTNLPLPKTQNNHIEVVVIGAGPSGTAAAIELGRAGIPAIVLESGDVLKDKPCGDALLPSAVKLLNEYQLWSEDFLALNGVCFNAIDLYNSSQLIWKHQLGENTGWVIRRQFLDQKLRDMAARTATIQYNAHASGVENIGPNNWKVYYRQRDTLREITCSAVILATGCTNKLSRSWNICGLPLGSSSITTYVTADRSEALVFQFTSQVETGYGWIFPMPEGQINIGVCSLQPGDKELKRKGLLYLKKHQLEGAIKWRGGYGPLWSGRSRTWHHSWGLVSCGDAAGLIDPINGEGITAALVSGQQAGKAICNHLEKKNEKDHLKAYSDFIYKCFQEKYGSSLSRSVWKKICRIP